MRRFAISDIHGCARTFGALLNKINLSPVDELFLLGDFIDRGPDSKGVLRQDHSAEKPGLQDSLYPRQSRRNAAASLEK
jgi:serine/threonine protein phosphatase 1